MSLPKDFGLYFHIPFCSRRCDYCSFATWDDRQHLISSYVSAVVAELKDCVRRGLPQATSVFFGGGTPSLLSAGQLTMILESAPIAAGAEVTVECNPDDAGLEKLDGYRRAGVNRISLGVQSMVPKVLGALGRQHGVDNVVEAVESVVKAGFDSFNLDLIYGAASETLDDWAETVQRAIELKPEHVSAYALTVEPGTPLANDKSRAPDDDDQADKYVLAEELLSGAGLNNYEISNWARPGYECQHNLLYWSQGDYRGLGCAAHSHERGRRWWNVRTPERYIASVESGESPEAGAEVLDEGERALEGLQLALRTRLGVPVWALPSQEVAPGGSLHGLVDLMGERLVLNQRGRLLANEVALALQCDASNDGSAPVEIGRDR